MIIFKSRRFKRDDQKILKYISGPYCTEGIRNPPYALKATILKKFPYII
jgi:hypothetical protein